MDKKQVQETYRETTPEEEQEYFEEVENELQCDLQTTQESIDYRNQAIKAQKKYMRDSHGDMDDEEFLQNMNNVNNDTFFIEHVAKQVDVLAHQIENPYFGKIAFEYQEDGQVLPDLCSCLGKAESLPYGGLRRSVSPRPITQHGANLISILRQIGEVYLAAQGLL